MKYSYKLVKIHRKLLAYMLRIKYFLLIDQKISKIEDLAFQSHGGQLKMLNLSSNMIREVNDLTFSHLSSLKTLDLASKRLKLLSFKESS